MACNQGLSCRCEGTIGVRMWVNEDVRRDDVGSRDIKGCPPLPPAPYKKKHTHRMYLNMTLSRILMCSRGVCRIYNEKGNFSEVCLFYGWPICHSGKNSDPVGNATNRPVLTLTVAGPARIYNIFEKHTIDYLYILANIYAHYSNFKTILHIVLFLCKTTMSSSYDNSFYYYYHFSAPPPLASPDSVSPCPSPGRASYLANRVIESRPMSGASCGAVAIIVIAVVDIVIFFYLSFSPSLSLSLSFSLSLFLSLSLSLS